MPTMHDAIRVALQLSTDTSGLDAFAVGFEDEAAFRFPDWVQAELQAAGETDCSEAAVRYRALLATAKQIPNWTAQASSRVLLDAIGDGRLIRGAESALEHRSNLVLMGPTGIGKTAALGWVTRQLGFQWLGGGYLRRLRKIVERLPSDRSRELEYEVSRLTRLEATASDIVWATAYEITECAKWHKLGEGEPPLHQALRTKPYAFIDDIGNESRGTEALFSILDTRYESGLTTFASTGLTSDDLADRYGLALVRRLQEVRGKPATVVDLFRQAKVRAVK